MDSFNNDNESQNFSDSSNFSTFDFDDLDLISRASYRIKNEKVLTGLLYIPNKLVEMGFDEAENPFFFTSFVQVTEDKKPGFLLVNPQGFYSNCYTENEIQFIFSWDSLTNIKIIEEDDFSIKIELVSNESSLIINEPHSKKLKLILSTYETFWKSIIIRFANESEYDWDIIQNEMGVSICAFESFDDYINWINEVSSPDIKNAIRLVFEGSGSEFNQGFISESDYQKWLAKKRINLTWDEFCVEELAKDGYFDVSEISSFTGLDKYQLNFSIYINNDVLFTGSFDEFVQNYFEEEGEIPSNSNESKDYGVYKFPKDGNWNSFFGSDEFNKRMNKLVTTLTSEFFTIESEFEISGSFNINKFGFLTLSTDEMGYGKDFGDYIIGVTYKNQHIYIDFPGGVGELSTLDIS